MKQRRTDQDEGRESTPRWDWRRRVPTAFGVLCALVGILGILAAAGAVRADLAGDASLWSGLPAMASAASGILYLIVARGLIRREHTAWVWLVSLMTLQLVLAAAGMVADGGHATRTHGAGLRIAVGALLLAVVVAASGEFTVGRGRPRRSTTMMLVSLAVLGPLASWCVLTVFSPGTSGGAHRAVCGTWFLVRWLVGIRQPHFDAQPPAWIPLSVGLAGAAAVLLAAYLTLRPSRRIVQRPGHGTAEVRELLAAHGAQDSLGYFALRPDKAVVLSATGKAAVCYRLVNGVSLAAGDPIGAPSEWPGAIKAWRDEAVAHGWTPAVLGAGPAGARAYSRAGLRVLEIGDEAILHAGEFTLEGRPMRGVRQAVQRVRRAGFQVRIHRVGDVAPNTMDELAEYAEKWRDGPTERGFSMALGRFAHPDDLEYVVVEARDAEGRPAAVLGFVPWGSDGLSLDLMRRGPESPNGLFEFMIAELMAQAGVMGLQRVSLNFAMFRSVFARGERLGAGPLLRWLYGILKILSRWWQLESLYRANQKYQPTWQPRFVCYPRGRTFPRVAVAAAMAEGFVAAPGLRRTAPPSRDKSVVTIDRTGAAVWTGVSP
ncbi:phosphatidylglycerol lysyltransferase domain-containing protein [Actinoplanes sp. NEAU-A12]|uniref:Phosphatidylglycerol lysyltransferase domain-containing protein n=1 Tax=Actinoplanes sandaracinus TaxID=3045177 RepID=A0ABT6WXR9_9ACTN|nr:phosphatidylglycerol lysyltransferase domain-containing protein [Actinoplanes sandaracinus]MDI6104406.1 phosphatidylglycerol lysyltransferase domain-containing protein [Actinoplanes sandaracinus]